ncbi:MAG TPA: hypothetical protein VML19_29375 [Verrucomicrobiae bacterium]|nr:hypothetical protein [Verrucomicrobiae bacterium]
MITTTVVAILGALLLLVLMELFKKQKAPAQPVEDLANLKASDARIGDSISISGAGDSMTDLDLTADSSTWIDTGSRRWFELSGPYKNRRVTMRVDSSGDDLEVALHADPRKLTIQDLGLSEEDLAEMDERQNTGDTFDFDGKTWLFRMSCEAHATRNNLPQPRGFYYWEFREQNGGGILAVRKEQNDPFAVVLYQSIPPENVTVYRGR